MRPLALLPLLLLGCEGKHDTQLANVTLGGLKLVVRHREHQVRPPCRDGGLSAYKCLFVPRTRNGCTYVEIDGPLRLDPDENPCGRSRVGRRWLSHSADRAEIEVDPAGARLAWRSGDDWSVGYVLDGELLLPPPQNMLPARSTSHPAIDWRALKTIEEAAPALYFEAGAEHRPALLKRMREAGGDRVVTEMLTSTTRSVFDPAWEAAYQTLDDEHRHKVAGALLTSVFEESNDDAVPWLDAHPEMKPAGFDTRLRQLASEVIDLEDQTFAQRWLQRAWRLHDPAAPAFACRLLEQRELNDMWRAPDLETGLPSGDLDGVAYAVIAASQTKCAAVTRAWSGTPCASALRCQHLDSNLDALCDASDLPAMKEALLSDEARANDPDFDSAAKMNALLAQGPLPKGYLLKNERRAYEQLHVPDGGIEDIDAISGSPCAAGIDRVADFVCALRPEQTRVEVQGCTVELDDAKKVVRLITPDEDGGR
ncbi:MAG: hypothetical protein QM723_21905 [Myxococcaceae bacterium]